MERVLIIERQGYLKLDAGEKNRLKKAIGERIFTIEPAASKRPILFKSLYSDIKKNFNVGSYKELNKIDLQKAIKFVDRWIPTKGVY